MNNKKVKGIVIMIAVILLCIGWIYNCKFIDYNNSHEETIALKIFEMGKDYHLDINKDYDIYLDTIKFIGITDGNIKDWQVTLNLRDKYGYLLYQQTLNAENETDNILHPQAKLKKYEDYTIEIVNIESIDIAESDIDILITYYQYIKLPNSIRIIIIISILIILSLIYLISTNNNIYNKIKTGIIGVFNANTPPGYVEYAIWFLLFLIPFVTMMYGDTRAFVHYEVNFWKSIKEGGGIKYFYEFSNKMIEFYPHNNAGGGYEVIYDFSVYIMLGIWGLPLWLICTIFNIEETSHFATMLYGKSIYLVFLPIAAHIIYKICKNIGLNDKNSKWSAFLFLSSAVVFVEIGIMGQLDILGIPFTLLGIYYFQKRCKWKFILFFAIAISFKQFPLFAFLPLLLLIEKKTLKIIADLAVAVGFTFLINLPFPKDTVAMSIKGEIRDKFIEIFLGMKLPVYNGIIPLIVILIGIICIFCYLKEIENQEELEQYSIFIPLLVTFVLFAAFDSNPYWFIHLSPYLAITIMYNSKHFNKLILFETIGMLCLILNQFASNYWCFDTKIGEGMLLDVIFGRAESYLTVEKLLPYVKLDKFSPVCFAGYLLAIGTVIWLSRPGHIEKEDSPVRWQALLRLVLNAGISMVPVFLYVVSVIIY